MLSIVWNPQRGSRIYIEKRRGRKEIEVTRRRRGGVQRRETDLASNHFLSVPHSLEHTKRFTELGREEKGDGEDRGDLREKKESQKGERVIKPVITLLSKNGYGILKCTKLITNTIKQRLKI